MIKFKSCKDINEDFLYNIGIFERRLYMLAKKIQKKLVRVAMEEAEKAILRGDEPYGGVIVDQGGNIIAQNGNRENTELNPSAHAEIVLIRETCKKIGKNDLSEYILVCNYRPCPMCAAALIMAGIREFYFGSYMGGFIDLFNRTADNVDNKSDEFIVVDSILNQECTEQVHRGRSIRAED